MTTATAAVKDFAPNDVQARRQGLGGSDAAAAIGCNPYKSPYELWLEKTGRVTPEPAGEAAYWGNTLEDIVAKEYAKRNGLKVRRDNKTRVHPDHPFMYVHLDRRIVGQNRALEVKTAHFMLKGFDEEWTDQIPMQYLAQCHHANEVCDLEGTDIAMLRGGQKLETFVVNRNREFGQMICEYERVFWEEFVLADVAPAPTCDRDLANIEVKNEEVEATTEIMKSIGIIYDLQAKLKEFKAALETEKNRVKFFMNDKTKLVCGNQVLATLPKFTKVSLDTKEIKEKYPALYERHAKQTEYRRFTVK